MWDWITQLNYSLLLYQRKGQSSSIAIAPDRRFFSGITSEKAARDLFNDIGVKIQFLSEKQDRTIPFEFLGVISDYNGVDIIQTPDYIEMSCKNYILRLLKSHG